MSLVDPRVALHCAHCGRAVAETRHTRSSYRVDYYSLHTGDVEPVALQHGDEPPVTVFKLLTAHDVVTCVECYRKPQVRARRERLFRPELQQEAAS